MASVRISPDANGFFVKREERARKCECGGGERVWGEVGEYSCLCLRTVEKVRILLLLYKFESERFVFFFYWRWRDLLGVHPSRLDVGARPSARIVGVRRRDPREG